jgi:hypothetical protein
MAKVVCNMSNGNMSSLLTAISFVAASIAGLGLGLVLGLGLGLKK